MKRFLSCLLACALLLAMAVPALAVRSQVSTQKLSVNGTQIDCERYNIDGSNYFKLRDLAALLNGTGSQFDVGYDAAKRLVSITTGHAYTDPRDTDLVVGADKSATTAFSTQTVMIDGVPRSDLRAYNIGGNNYFQLRELGAALGFDVDYDAPTRTMLVQSRSSAIRVSDLCALQGSFTERSGYITNYSFVLPKVTGADTAFLREINSEMERLYRDYADDALWHMREDESLTRFCMSYSYGVKNGVHSLLVTSDNDWDMNEYWCYSFDDSGNRLENAAVLAAAGLTADGFVALARAYLQKRMDYSAYPEAEGWQELRDKTLAADNLNADVPMAILPNGNLFFVCKVYTIAGAGEYDEAFEISGGKTVADADVGETLLSKLRGTFLADSGDGDEATLYEFVSVGDTLTLEVTNFYSEYGSVSSYSAIDLYPEDPAALYRADVSSLRVRAVSWCPDVFGGSYSGDARSCLLSVTKDGISLVNYADDGSTITAKRCERGDLGLADGIPELDSDHFRYDDAAAAGLPGIWTGTYVDGDFETHDVTLQLTGWGQMRLRDCAPNAIPRMLEGAYYIAGLNDDVGPAGSVVFRLAARGGYKMPVIGYTTMVSEKDTLRIYEEDDSDCPLTELDLSFGPAELTRLPEVRCVAQPEIRTLAEGERVTADIAGDGVPEEISYTFLRDTDGAEAITGVRVTVEGEEFTLNCLDAYTADVRLLIPAMHGTAYLYIDGVSDNDFHITAVVGVRLGEAWFIGNFRGGFSAVDADSGTMRLFRRTALLSTVNAARAYRPGLSGMPEAIDSFYRIDNDLTLTSKRAIFCWVVDPATGALTSETAQLPAGTGVKLIRTDAVSAVDLRLPDGAVRRVFVSDWPRCIDGVPIEDCFDGLRFAG